MLMVIKDAFCNSRCWNIIGAENVGSVLNDIKIIISEERKEKTYPGVIITEELEAALNTINEEISKNDKKKQEEIEEQFLKEKTAAEKTAAEKRATEESENIEFKESTGESDINRPVHKIKVDNSISISSFKGKTVLVFGNYNHTNRTITLYIKSILEDAKNTFLNDDISEENRVYFNFAHQLVATLAHEMFHAYHAADYDNHGRNWITDAQENEIIVESLASYFELKVLNNILSRFDLAMSLLLSWDKYYAVAWPYSGAKYIRYNRFFVIDKETDDLIKKSNNAPAEKLFSALSNAIIKNDPCPKSDKDEKTAIVLYKLSLEGLSYAQSLLLSCEKQNFFRFAENALNNLS